MPLRITTDPQEIISLLTPVLQRDPVRHTIFATITKVLADGWCAVAEDGSIAVRSEPTTPLTLTGDWPRIEPLAQAIASLETVTAVGGPVTPVEALVADLARRGHPSGLRVSERLFRLDELTEPTAVAGSARLAGQADAGLLADWLTAFMLEAWPAMRPGFDAAALVSRALSTGRPWLWLDPGGVPVAMAVGHARVFGVARIGPVYTPPELRGHGYGAAVTAAATRDILDDRAVPVLFTDLANPTSNRIYQRLGYRPVEDRLHVEFAAQPTGCGAASSQRPNASDE